MPPCSATDSSDGSDDELLILSVRPSGSTVHANTKDEVFLRVGDENRRLSFTQRQELQFDRGHDTYEAQPLSHTGVDALATSAVEAYVEQTGASSAKRLLLARGLLVDDRLTVAGALLFAELPQRWLPERVDVFDDRIEVHSPGRFPGIVDLYAPRDAPRFARNPRIARVCADLRFGQELGEGIRRIFEEMRLAGLQEPEYSQSAASVRLTLSGEPVQEALDKAFTPEARAISGALREAGRLSTGEVAELLGRSRPPALKVLAGLEDAGLIRWVGKSKKDPRAYWEIVRR